ncbi:MAG: SDR family oxidoreductase [Micropruina sp.]|nr:MAG: SDR family oxidoreductase [Micropruina sp.]
MTLLVLGATGTIGREVVAQLLSGGRGVRALTRNAARARRLLGADVQVVEGDLTSSAALAGALEGVEGIVLTHGGDSDPERIYYGAAKALVDALGERSIPVALMSSINVTRGSGSYANLMNWKRRGERILRASGVPLTVIRPGWFGSTEPRAALQQGDTVSYGPVTNAQVAQALIAGLDNPGYTAELFSGPGAPVTDWTAAFGALDADQPRALDGARDPASLPETSEPERVRADLATARAQAQA